jgi:hypothetical protein
MKCAVFFFCPAQPLQQAINVQKIAGKRVLAIRGLTFALPVPT